MPIPKECTLLDLLWSVNEVTEDEREAVATVVYLINTGRVRLCGNFAGAKITLPNSAVCDTLEENREEENQNETRI